MPPPENFWSRRRRAVADAERREETARDELDAARTREALETREDAEILELLGLPDPSTLTPRDAAAFMARQVPARLRRRAMRALFQRHPELSVPDGLVDYDEDYTAAGQAQRPAKTIWTATERLREAPSEPLSPDPDPTPAVAEPLEDTPVVDPVLAEAESDVEVEPEDDPGPIAPTHRRMTFRFKDET